MSRINEVSKQEANPRSKSGARWTGIVLLTLSVSAPACSSDPAASSSATGGAGSSPITAGSTSTAGTSASVAGAANPSSAGSGGAPSAAGSVGTSGASSGGANTAGANTAGANTAGANTAGASTGGAHTGGAGGGAAGNGSAGAPSVTCPTPALQAGNSDKTLMVGGSSRSYTLHVPSTYNGSKPVPLVLDFHGLGGNGKGESTSSPYPAQTDADGVIMAFPTGLSGPGGNAWNVGPCCVKNTDDVAFAKALVSEIEKTACIDTKRVYAVGFSMGGGMSHYLACHAADVFAAVAPAAFDLLKENVDDCKPPRPISEITFRSTGDNVVAYAGGASMAVQGMPITFLGAKGTFQKWAEINQCTGPASAEDANGCATYAGCPTGIEVTLCTKQGGTHEPGNAKVGWPALKKHTLP